MAPKDQKTETPRTDAVFAGMVATLLTHPLDVLKIRLQLSPSKCGSLRLASQLLKYEGLQSFYCGLTAGLLRQATYTATRLAMYDALYHTYTKDKNKRLEFSDKILIGICAGLAGGLVGNPSEVVLVRRIAEGCCNTPSGSHCCRYTRTYTGTIDALRGIVCGEGLLGLWRGTTLTLLRSVFLSAIYVGSSTQIQDYVKEKTHEKDPFTLHMYTAVAMGFISALLTHPIDLVKTYYQASRSDTLSQKEIFQYTVSSRGILGLWSGFTPYFIRLVFHTVISYLVLDSMKDKKI